MSNITSTFIGSNPPRIRNINVVFPQFEFFVTQPLVHDPFFIFANHLIINRVSRNVLVNIFFIIPLHFSRPADERDLVSIFKEPKEPKTKIIMLESLDGKPLQVARKQTSRLQRNNTQDSITTIGSQESATGAYERLQDRSANYSGRNSIRGLIIEFYDNKGEHSPVPQPNFL